MTHDKMDCLCIEDIIAAACLASDHSDCTWPPDDITLISFAEMPCGLYVVVKRRDGEAKCIRLSRVKERAKKIGIDLWDCEPEG